MPHIYMQFDFGKDEEKAQLARHKLETWKQAFRLDKKLLYNFERTADGVSAAAEAVAAKSEKPKAKGKSKAKEEPEAPTSNETVRLLLRLGFVGSGHSAVFWDGGIRQALCLYFLSLDPQAMKCLFTRQKLFTGRHCDRRWSGWGGGRHARRARRNWRSRHSRFRTLYRGWPDHGRIGGRRGRRSSRGFNRSTGRDGHPRI